MNLIGIHSRKQLIASEYKTTKKYLIKTGIKNHNLIYSFGNEFDVVEKINQYFLMILSQPLRIIK